MYALHDTSKGLKGPYICKTRKNEHGKDDQPATSKAVTTRRGYQGCKRPTEDKVTAMLGIRIDRQPVME